MISVPTPLNGGNPDLSHITAAATQLSAWLRPGATVVLESTTYPGTTTELVAPLLEDGSGLVAGADFHLGYSPERIDPGNPQWRFENTPKVVSGIDDRSLAAVAEFYDRLVSQTVPVSSPAEAELTKLLENTFRHVNIALVNELAMYAHDLGIDVWEAIDAASTKPFGYLRFTPGPGVGGHCLPVDPSYLSWRVRQSLGVPFRFVELANDVNAHMPDYVVRRLTLALNQRHLSVNGQRILLLGLAYKRNTGDARETPSRPIAEQLVELGAEVLVADPHVGRPGPARRRAPGGADPRRGGVGRGHRAAGRPRRLRPGGHRRGRALPARHPPPGRGPAGGAPLIGRWPATQSRRRWPPNSHPARNDTTTIPPSSSHRGNDTVNSSRCRLAVLVFCSTRMTRITTRVSEATRLGVQRRLWSTAPEDFSISPPSPIHLGSSATLRP